MSGTKGPPPSTGPAAPGLDEIQAAVGKRLDDVAKILAGALVAVAGIMTTLGLNSKFVFVALNNRSWPIYVASLCAIIAIVCSIAALLIRPTGRGVLWETGVLVLGVVFYMASLSIAVVGAAQAAGGNGRPTITDLRLEGPRPNQRLHFEVHADGVQKWSHIVVSVTPEDAPSGKNTDLYWSILRPDEQGEIAQRVDIPFAPPAGTSVVALSAVNPDQSTDLKCEIKSQHGPACTELHLS
ncbi:hypothetical protein [Streptomyces griseocarneus]|uniref:hypothetical protein n=1 Tax=Streptomyces griseocarneus TaxID=51201 RepID=UPI00167E0959|nr:hypothetical protein [Streptomyces griseocarneus]MBZ6477913.1 hypothetical protein [Streptomyces griseocarneus]GHG54284.1 hypothetical protein GCM10018779_17110 [Streptomyces griseocarneus]